MRVITQNSKRKLGVTETMNFSEIIELKLGKKLSCILFWNHSCLRTFARKTSTTQIFFIFWPQSDNELPMSEIQKIGGTTTSFSK